MLVNLASAALSYPTLRATPLLLASSALASSSLRATPLLLASAALSTAAHLPHHRRIEDSNAFAVLHLSSANSVAKQPEEALHLGNAPGQPEFVGVHSCSPPCVHSCSACVQSCSPVARGVHPCPAANALLRSQALPQPSNGNRRQHRLRLQLKDVEDQVELQFLKAEKERREV